jgi:hypothetical protein
VFLKKIFSLVVSNRRRLRLRSPLKALTGEVLLLGRRNGEDVCVKYQYFENYCRVQLRFFTRVTDYSHHELSNLNISEIFAGFNLYFSRITVKSHYFGNFCRVQLRFSRDVTVKSQYFRNFCRVQLRLITYNHRQISIFRKFLKGST